MRNELRTLIFASVAVGCGDSGREMTAGGTGTSPTAASLVTLSDSSPTEPTPTEGSATDSGATAGSVSNSDSQGTETTQTPSAPSSMSDTNDSGIKTDLGQQPDFGLPSCGGGGGGGGGDPDFSYIWIANSAQNTISKIDTQTLVELGRYLVRPDGLGNPSRTSVNLSGDVVTATQRFVDVVERETSRGPMVFFTSESRWTNQDGAMVRVGEATTIYW